MMSIKRNVKIDLTENPCLRCGGNRIEVSPEYTPLLYLLSEGVTREERLVQALVAQGMREPDARCLCAQFILDCSDYLV